MPPKTKITRDKMDDHPSRSASVDFIKKSGKALKPVDHIYQGTAVVHFYAHQKEATFAFIAHCVDLKSIPEPQADAGSKELIRAMMSQYGRKFQEKKDPGLSIVDNI